MSQYLFNRIVKAIIGTATTEALVFDENFHITFDVQKNKTALANIGVIQIYNLAESTRNKLADIIKRNAELRDKNQEPLILLLFAGYKDGDGYELLYSGDITRVTTIVQTPDIIIKLEAGDGAFKLKDSTIAASFAAGISSNNIISQIAKSLKMDISNSSNYVDKDITLAHGDAFSGHSKEYMDKIANAANLDWHIENGKMVITTKGTPTTDSIQLISARTGMIKSPEKLENAIGDIAEKVSYDGWKVPCLLLPDITPGRKVRIESKVINGDYAVDSVEHQGDNRGDQWNTTFETKFIGL